jgi:hypothetical protein
MIWIAIALAILLVVTLTSLVMAFKVGLWLLAVAFVGLIFFAALAAFAIWLINWLITWW